MLRLIVVIPHYNHPTTLVKVVQSIVQHDLPVVVVDDGSSPESAQALHEVRALAPACAVTLLEHTINQGKGAAMLTGLRYAHMQGYTHALQIDADGQHNSLDIPQLVALAQQYPQAVICGIPIYDASVPKGRLYGRYLTHVWVWINTLSLRIKDSMCGFRSYPLAPTLAVMDSEPVGKRMDFDTEILVRLFWRGIDVHNLPTAVTYPQDGQSHFQMWNDNLRIALMHARLFRGMLLRLPQLLRRKRPQ
ncbi:glycosyltransferase family 2 protein [Lampropedia puyangensis]|uniref:Glycosyltransferase family 2 protein n=1 Tax=Lampropedia puyangensis TaxID=1330072 RepID=A0A4S8F589_9BURK|nr:glycosyltransferase family 2 protein [Lampropedia puyangensis]THU02580.1 glycosyltransferase family 2 protein [Lampropedia puyangensis]